MNDPLLPHLLDLLREAPANSFILGGGFGLRVKQANLDGSRTLAGSIGEELPEARATTDLDLFLRIELFSQDSRGRDLRSAIDRLGYQAKTPNLQFEKQIGGPHLSQSLFLDLMARSPEEGSGVKAGKSRVGSGSETGLHGRETVEAFAVEQSPVLCNLESNGTRLGQVQVAHPYALLNMKIRAAHDWFRYQTEPWILRDGQQPPSPKHVFDATLVVAVLMEEEIEQSKTLASGWNSHLTASEIKGEADQLFGSPMSLGWATAMRQGMFDDHAVIWNAMRQLLGIS